MQELKYIQQQLKHKIKHILQHSYIPFQNIFNQINRARSNPKQYATLVQKQLNQFVDQFHFPLNNTLFKSQQGKIAWYQTLKFLLNQQPLYQYCFNQGLLLAADDHVDDLARYNIISHISSNRESLSDRINYRCGQTFGYFGQNIGSSLIYQGFDHAVSTVLGLIISDGIQNRGPRKSVYSTDYKYIGCSSRKIYDKILTVINYHSQNINVVSVKQKYIRLQEYKQEKRPKWTDQQIMTNIEHVKRISQINIQDIVGQINKARSKPRQYSTLVQQQLQQFLDQKHIPLKQGLMLKSHQGQKVWKQTIEFLKNQQPLYQYCLKQSLILSAFDHTNYLLKYNTLDHHYQNEKNMTQRIEYRCGKKYGKWGQNIGSCLIIQGKNLANQTILSLIIDDGAYNKGQRKSVFSRQYKYIGCFSRKFKDNLIITVINYHSQNVDNIYGKKIILNKQKNQIQKKFNEVQKINKQNCCLLI